MSDNNMIFNAACHEFNTALKAASHWKHSYFGVAYETRLEYACDDLEKAIARIRKALKENKK